MLFNSTIFLFLFLPISLTLYYVVKNRTYRNVVLFIVNIIFYAFGEPIYILLLFASITFNYFFGLLIHKSAERANRKKAFLIISVIVNLLLLVFFKYLMMIQDAINAFIGLCNGNQFEPLKIALPIGISFYTFQSLSYIIDIYKGTVEPQKNYINYGVYIAFFPQLIAGPIVRYSDVNFQLTNRVESVEKFAEGIRTFIVGLAQKAILANYLAVITDNIFNSNVSAIGAGDAWIGILSYTLQIYFDFAGYSLMAIGLAKMFGFDFPQNFNRPYLATSIKDFWRRWHITLSSWLRDYLYIPLGGNRKGKARTYLNLIIVFALCGLWHGANWTFVVWGLFHGIFLVLERLPFLQKLKKTPRVFKHIYTLFVVVIGWVFFRADTVGYAFSFIGNMFFANGAGFNVFVFDVKFAIIFALSVICCFPIPSLINNKITLLGNEKLILTNQIITYTLLTVLLLLCVPVLISETANPFIYFKF